MKTGKSKDHLQRVFLRFLYLIMGSILSLDSVMAAGKPENFRAGDRQ